MFFTIPNTDNEPVMINLHHIVSISYDMETNVSSINLINEQFIDTFMPRDILVNMINKLSNKPQTVQPTTEWAG